MGIYAFSYLFFAKNLDEFDHDLTSWRHWNDGECMGESSPNGRNSRTAHFRIVNDCSSVRCSQ